MGGWNPKISHPFVLAAKAPLLKPCVTCCHLLMLVSDHVREVPCVRASAEGSVVEHDLKCLANGAVMP